MVKLLLFLLASVPLYLRAQPIKDPPPAPGGEDVIATLVDELPGYPGGNTAMLQYISDHIVYPSGTCIEGRVWISFLIEKDGSVSRCEVARGIGEEADREALRVARMLKKRWKPAMLDGKPVRYKCTGALLSGRKSN